MNMKYTRFATLIIAAMLCTVALLPAQAIYCSYFNKHGNHNWKDEFVETSPTCTQNGVMYIECVECGEPGIRVMDKLAHVYGDWRVTRQPTENSMGARERTCQVCGSVQAEDVWPNGTIRKGSSRSMVESLQSMLVSGGFLDAVNGVYDEQTEQAVRTVQMEAGFSVNGIAWPETIGYLVNRYGMATVPAATAKPTVTPAPAATEAPTAVPTPVVTAAVQSGYVLDASLQRAYCTQVEIERGVMAVVYCPVHQALLENCEMMLSFAQTDALKLEALRMYRMMWENEMNLLYQKWAAGSDSDEDKGMIMSHQAMYTSYLSMQESTWTRMYGAGSIRIQEQVIASLMQQCADVCMMSAPLE